MTNMETRMAVAEKDIAELNKMVKGNGSPGMYRTVIETHEKVTQMSDSMKEMKSFAETAKPVVDKFPKIEKGFWSLGIILAGSAVCGLATFIIWVLQGKL